MKQILKIIGAILLSMSLYFVLFSVFKKAIEVGHIKDIYDDKEAYAEKIGKKKKIVIVAGSNGLYSHSCAEMERQTGLKCLNAALTITMGLDLILEKSKKFINKGDIVILPLEYYFYSYQKNKVISAETGNKYIFQYDRTYLTRFDAEKTLTVLFSFRFKDMFLSAIEMAADFAYSGKHFVVMNENGDMIGHTREKGKAFEKFRKQEKQMMPSGDILTTEFYSQKVIVDFIKWSNERGASVYGSLPTTFNDEKLDDKVLKKIKDLYYSNGAGFIELPNNSQYERSCFYHTSLHLNEECQKEHSIKIANYLMKHLK